jgi:hypothetical protein
LQRRQVSVAFVSHLDGQVHHPKGAEHHIIRVQAKSGASSAADLGNGAPGALQELPAGAA